MSTALYLEYEAVLARPQLFAGSALGGEDRGRLFDAFLSRSRWVRVYFLWRPNLPDEADNHVMELAIAGGAVLLITKNVRDFRQSELLFPDLKILSPEDLLKEFRDGHLDTSTS